MSYQKTGFGGRPLDPNWKDPTKSGPQSEADVIKAAMQGKVQVQGASGYEYVEPSERPSKSSSGGGILGSISNTVSNVGGKITEAVKPVADNLTPNLGQDLAKPVQELAQQAVDTAVMPVTEGVKAMLGPAEAVMDVVTMDYAGKAGEAVQTAIDNTADIVTDTVNKLDINTEQLKPNFVALSPNLDQDLRKISLRGLQESAVKQAGDLQKGAVQVGSAVQQSLIDAGSAMQQNAIDLGSLTGKSNPTLENYAAQGTKYIEEKVVPTYADAVQTAVFQNPTVQAAKEVVNLGEKNTVGIENLGDDTSEFLGVPGKALNLLLGGATISTYGKNAEPASYSDNYASAPTLGDSTTFEDMEASTGKGSKLTEEERLKRIRRLLLNRYGRENTILTTGPGDTKSRRRYAL